MYLFQVFLFLAVVTVGFGPSTISLDSLRGVEYTLEFS